MDPASVNISEKNIKAPSSNSSLSGFEPVEKIEKVNQNYSLSKIF